MKVCTRCGTENLDASRFCSNCNAALPQIIADAQAGGVLASKVMERYYQLKDAAEKVKNGEWTLEEYSSYLEGIAQVLAQKEQEIREIEIPEEAYEDFAEELEVGFNGIALYNEGIAHMMLYLEDQDPDHLDYGLDLVYQGNEQINEAMRINRDNRKKLEEMYIDTSTMM